MNNNPNSSKILLFFKGLAMGAANKVPGVSGGMVAFVMGFYEELIQTFKKFDFKALKLILKGQFKAFVSYTNLNFLCLVMGGSITSYFTVSLVLDYLIKNFELYVWSWFFGLIIGSIYYISKDFKYWNFKNSIGLILGACIGIGISFLEPATQNDNLWFVFFCGIIGVSGMTLPGLSGSFILILLGNYVILLVDSVNVFGEVIINIISGNFSILNNPEKIYYLKIMIVFTLGSGFGLISISHLITYLLKRFKPIILSIIIGFITGSLGNVWPWKNKTYKTINGNNVFDAKGNKIIVSFERYLPEFNNSETWIALTLIAFGIGLVILIDYYERQKRQ